MNSKKIFALFMMVFMGLFMVEPALAAGVDTASTGILQKWIDWLVGIRGSAITLAVIAGALIILFARKYIGFLWGIGFAIFLFVIAPYVKDWL